MISREQELKQTTEFLEDAALRADTMDDAIRFKAAAAWLQEQHGQLKSEQAKLNSFISENAALHTALKQAVKIGTDWHYQFVELEQQTRKMREQAKQLYDLANAPEGTIQ